jgi:hypothetical protein
VEIRLLEHGEAFPAVLAHAYCYSLDDVERNREMVRHYLDLCAHIPVFGVTFRAGMEHVAAILDAIEAEVGIAPVSAS